MIHLKRTRHFLDRSFQEDAGEFATRDAAEAYVAKCDSVTYVCDENELGRPVFLFVEEKKEVKSGKPKRSLPTTDGNGTPDGGSGI
jgi:hypothetical protein